MLRLFACLLISFCMLIHVLAGVLIDSTTKQQFQNLADKMGLKTPNLKDGEYEVRIWNEQALRYGDAQMLYVLTKTKRKFIISKYLIDSDRRGFRHAIRLNPNPKIPIGDTLWTQFVQQGIIDLPDMSLLHDKLYPKPPKDSTWTAVEADGSVSIKAKRRNTNWVITGDGEGYYFEVCSAGTYRSYSYRNPRSYLKSKPNISELQKVVAILDNLAVLFHSSN